MNTYFANCWLIALFVTQVDVLAATINNKIVYRLERTESSGFTLPDLTKSSQCTIYNNGSIVNKRFANNISTTSHKKALIAGDLQVVIRNAALGKFTIAPYKIDADSIRYIAYPDKFPPHVKLAPIVLFEQNGNTGQEKINDSTYASTLRNFIDLTCDSSIKVASFNQSNQQIGNPVDYSVILQFGQGWEYRYADTIPHIAETFLINDTATLSTKWNLWFDENQLDGTQMDGNGNIIYKPVFPVMPTIDFSKDMLIVIFGAKSLSQITETDTSIYARSIYQIPIDTNGKGCVEPAVVRGPALIIAKFTNINNKLVNFVSTNVYVPCGKG